MEALLQFSRKLAWLVALQWGIELGMRDSERELRITCMWKEKRYCDLACLQMLPFCFLFMYYSLLHGRCDPKMTTAKLMTYNFAKEMRLV